MIHIPAHIVAQMFSYAAMLKLTMAKQFGLNPSQLFTLGLVGSTDQLSIKELRQKLSIPGSSLTFTIDSLEKKRLIKRQRGKEDRRQWFLSLTAKGKQLHEEILKTEGKVVSPALDKLSEKEKEIFMKLAQEIIHPSA
jgi:DNA-binding MarR family transcriptional regulator